MRVIHRVQTRPPATGHLETDRIEALTDGVFAIVMTLLVHELRVPHVEHPSELPGQLAALWPNLVSYIISFVVLGVFWVGHHNQFHFIKRSDRKFMWINIFFLLSVSSIPFTAGLIGDYPGEQLALALYGLGLICTSLLLFTHWRYATTNGRLVDTPVDTVTQSLVSRRILTQPLVYVVAILVSFLSPWVSFIIYVATPLLYIFPTRLDQIWIGPGRSAQVASQPARDSAAESGSGIP